MMRAKRLERSSSDKVFTGVSGGMGEYLDVDPVLVRVAWVLLCFATLGVALVVYIVMALVMPREGSDGSAQEVVTENMGDLAEDASEFAHRVSDRRERTRNWFAIGLIIVGAVVLLANLGVFSFIAWDLVWPIALIAVGGAFLFARMRG